MTSATLDDPASVTPEDEVWTDREIPWATLLDDLPRHPRGRRGRRDADAGWSVYVVRTVDDRLYAGIATDVDRRFEEHRTGGPRAAKFLRAHPPAELAWSLPVGSKSLALKAEHRFKRLSRAEKEKVIGAPHVRIDPETGAWTVSGWTFRDATPEDLPTIVGWLADDPFGATRESVVAGPPDPRYARAFAEILADPNHTVVLAIGADGTPLGCLQWSRLPNLTYTGGPRAQIEGVRVAPEARGRGVGGALIGEAVRRAQDADCVLVQLTTDRRRPEAARFYSRAGFRATHHGMKLRLPDGPVVEP